MEPSVGRPRRRIPVGHLSEEATTMNLDEFRGQRITPADQPKGFRKVHS
jgi:hypothetical protein